MMNIVYYYYYVQEILIASLTNTKDIMMQIQLMKILNTHQKLRPPPIG